MQWINYTIWTEVWTFVWVTKDKNYSYQKPNSELYTNSTYSYIEEVMLGISLQITLNLVVHLYLLRFHQNKSINIMYITSSQILISPWVISWRLPAWKGLRDIDTCLKLLCSS